MEEKRGKYALFILGQSILYGFGNPLTKVAYESITPFWLLVTRYTAASLMLLLILRGRVFSELRRVSRKLWLPPALCCAGAYITCNLALNMTSATNVGFLISLPVLFTPFVAMAVLRERYELRRLPVQILLAVGLFMLCCGESGFSFGPGEVLGLIDALCLAGSLVFGEKALRELDGTVLTAAQAFVTLLLSLVGAVCFEDFSVLPGVQIEAWGVVLYLGLGCTVAAFMLQNHAVAHLSASTVSMLQCTQPILTAVISFLLLRERLSAVALAGAALIVAALLYDSRQGKRKEAAV